MFKTSFLTSILLFGFILLICEGITKYFKEKEKDCIEIQITIDSSDQISLSIWKNKIVWMDSRYDNWDNYIYDLQTNTESHITVDGATQWQPKINYNRIV